MFKLHTKSLISGSELSAQDLELLLDSAHYLKQQSVNVKLLQGKHLALLFNKPSLRTRFSFTVAMNELGGYVVESAENSRKEEEPEDQIRVIQSYCDAVLIRTHDDVYFERIKKIAEIPVINGLSHLYHPCQILADIFTLQEIFKGLNGLTISYVGDGNNILHSLLLMAPKLGISIRFACPPNYRPVESILTEAIKQQASNQIIYCETPEEAVQDTDAVYTDVWTSMGCQKRDEEEFKDFQVNETLIKKAKKHAVFMHCMPMIRGKEVSDSLPDANCSVIFQQSENRLHVQKALLLGLLM